MRNRLILLLVMLPLMIFSQNGITLKIEDLPKPAHLLNRQAYNDIYENLILKDHNLSKYQVKSNNIDFKYNIVARSKAPDSLVSFGYHSFFNGMYQAYAQHRPYVLSPDMIWLLISQGFAQHVNAHSEELRNQFVKHDGKLTLIVENKKIRLENPNSPWEEVFPEFTKQISEYTGKDLMKALTCDFTTTTPVSKVASEITIMEAMKSYFEFVVIYMSCGIPEIKLEGTTADWQKVLDKARYLRKYKLDWWIDEIEPLMVNFVKASKGDYDKDYWCNIYKVHNGKGCGSPDKIDGWIVKFFPYDKTGKRNDLKELSLGDNLPSEIVKVDLKHIEIDGAGNQKTTPLELWAGFVGLQQNPETFALKPEIGWMIKKKEVGKEEKETQQLTDELRAKSYNSVNYGGIEIRVFRIPKELLTLDQIKGLSINFTDEIIIPDEMAKIKIEQFKMSGKISDAGIDRIVKMFPNTLLIINNKTYNQKK